MTLLREAGMKPDEHLTDEQRELLVSADYYDRLNAATAYFPENGSQKYLQQHNDVEVEELDQEMGDEEQQDQMQ